MSKDQEFVCFQARLYWFFFVFLSFKKNRKWPNIYGVLFSALLLLWIFLAGWLKTRLDFLCSPIPAARVCRSMVVCACWFLGSWWAVHPWPGCSLTGAVACLPLWLSLPLWFLAHWVLGLIVHSVQLLPRFSCKKMMRLSRWTCEMSGNAPLFSSHDLGFP